MLRIFTLEKTSEYILLQTVFIHINLYCPSIVIPFFPGGHIETVHRQKNLLHKFCGQTTSRFQIFSDFILIMIVASITARKKATALLIEIRMVISRQHNNSRNRKIFGKQAHDFIRTNIQLSLPCHTLVIMRHIQIVNCYYQVHFFRGMLVMPIKILQTFHNQPLKLRSNFLAASQAL